MDEPVPGRGLLYVHKLQRLPRGRNMELGDSFSCKEDSSRRRHGTNGARRPIPTQHFISLRGNRTLRMVITAQWSPAWLMDRAPAPVGFHLVTCGRPVDRVSLSTKRRETFCHAMPCHMLSPFPNTKGDEKKKGGGKTAWLFPVLAGVIAVPTTVDWLNGSGVCLFR